MKTSNEAQKWIYVGASLNKPPIFNPTPISVHFVASTPPPGPYPIAACLSKIAHRNSIARLAPSDQRPLRRNSSNSKSLIHNFLENNRSSLEGKSKFPSSTFKPKLIKRRNGE
ncbi:hypothetical protein T10_12539 [Trichinella papuae]|uniref:Uncharacterized protein n=1 Tax=Trichinella papuae TaxID=268474 RepID=A0A0V1MDD1_9BILA|nr:hypothetical protein T10_12539 [Trichinella papuae]